MLSRSLALSLCLFSGAAIAQGDPAADAPADAPAEAAPPAPAPVNYAISAAKGLTYIVVLKDPDTLAAGLSHDHAIVSTGHSGSFTWNAADPAACRLDVTVPVAKLQPDLPAARKAAGFEGDLSEGQREDVRKNMLDSDQLNGSAHPNITFKSKGCSGGDGAFEVSGDLSIRGKSKAVVLKGKLSADGSSFRISGKLPLKATEFGFEPYSAMFGQLKNRNDMTLVVDLQGNAG